MKESVIMSVIGTEVSLKTNPNIDMEVFKDSLEILRATVGYLCEQYGVEEENKWRRVEHDVTEMVDNDY